MYDSAVAGIDWGLRVVVARFLFWKRRRKKEKKKTPKSRIICTFGPVEKVKPIKQLKKEAITPDEDR